MKDCEKRLSLKRRSFRKRSNFPRIWFRDLRIRFWGSRNQASESTKLRVTRVFFLSLLSHNFDDQLSSNFHRFVILCIVEIRQEWTLVFDNITKGVYTHLPPASFRVQTSYKCIQWEIYTNFDQDLFNTSLNLQVHSNCFGPIHVNRKWLCYINKNKLC